ncbi:hypothetical protein EYF80_019787 [Liparis tanakae]|uniref:Uncharacterized protein n=1 Tax=Liparis tanakae TaxID=230148 RepID=A0A4Z2HY22_9TELE|nr:hypothetical protein EYF80_019787 [Liparis tanakae]
MAYPTGRKPATSSTLRTPRSLSRDNTQLLYSWVRLCVSPMYSSQTFAALPSAYWSGRPSAATPRERVLNTPSADMMLLGRVSSLSFLGNGTKSSTTGTASLFACSSWSGLDSTLNIVPGGDRMLLIGVLFSALLTLHNVKPDHDHKQRHGHHRQDPHPEETPSGR